MKNLNQFFLFFFLFLTSVSNQNAFAMQKDPVTESSRPSSELLGIFKDNGITHFSHYTRFPRLHSILKNGITPGKYNPSIETNFPNLTYVSLARLENEIAFEDVRKESLMSFLIQEVKIYFPISILEKIDAHHSIHYGLTKNNIDYKNIESCAAHNNSPHETWDQELKKVTQSWDDYKKDYAYQITPNLHSPLNSQFVFDFSAHSDSFHFSLADASLITYYLPQDMSLISQKEVQELKNIEKELKNLGLFKLVLFSHIRFDDEQKAYQQVIWINRASSFTVLF